MHTIGKTLTSLFPAHSASKRGGHPGTRKPGLRLDGKAWHHGSAGASRSPV